MIYQVFVGRWQTANLKKHQGQVLAKLAEYDWQSLAKIGFSQIYLLGIFDNRGPIIVDREDGIDLKVSDYRLPSVFAITDHASVHPDLGKIADLKNLIDSIHQTGLKVICDFVPNHRGLNHIWINRHPQYFAKNQSGELIKEFSGDVAKLNYHSPELRKQMEKTLETIAQWGIDGVRCDMAHFVPIEFWYQATFYLKSKYPNFKFYGEVYPESPFDLTTYQTFIKNGFDGVYESILFKNLDKLIADQISSNQVCDHINYISQTNFSAQLINFFFNHDDYLADGYNYVEALLGVSLSLPGEFLTFNGSLAGLKKRLAHHALDILPTSELESKNLSVSILKILEFFKKNQTEFVFASSVQKQVIEIELKISQNKNSRFKLLANFSPIPISLKHVNLPKSEGQIHQYKVSENLKSGEVEVFCYEN